MLQLPGIIQVGPWGCGAVGPWGRGAVEPWGRGAVGPWGRGAVGPWGRGTVRLWGCGARGSLGANWVPGPGALAPAPPMITYERDQLHGRLLHGRLLHDSDVRSGSYLGSFATWLTQTVSGGQCMKWN